MKGLLPAELMLGQLPFPATEHVSRSGRAASSTIFVVAEDEQIDSAEENERGQGIQLQGQNAFQPENFCIISSQRPCAFRMRSQTWRTAPSPPLSTVT
jgi:hypothetical protein